VIYAGIVTSVRNRLIRRPSGCESSDETVDADVLHADGKRKGGALENYGAVHIFDVSNGKITRFREFVA
jgi:ketosteroid isomerase-like protein